MPTISSPSDRPRLSRKRYSCGYWISDHDLAERIDDDRRAELRSKAWKGYRAKMDHWARYTLDKASRDEKAGLELTGLAFDLAVVEANHVLDGGARSERAVEEFRARSKKIIQDLMSEWRSLYERWALYPADEAEERRAYARCFDHVQSDLRKLLGQLPTATAVGTPPKATVNRRGALSDPAKQALAEVWEAPGVKIANMKRDRDVRLAVGEANERLGSIDRACSDPTVRAIQLDRCRDCLRAEFEFLVSRGLSRAEVRRAMDEQIDGLLGSINGSDVPFGNDFVRSSFEIDVAMWLTSRPASSIPPETKKPDDAAEPRHPAKPSPLGSLSSAAERRMAVDAYIEDVEKATGKQLTRKDIWAKAGYRSRTEFERWERCDPKRPNKAAHEAFGRILRERPHLSS